MLEKFVLDSFCSVKENPTCIWIRLPLDYLSIISLFRDRGNRVPETKLALNLKHRTTQEKMTTLFVYTRTSLIRKDGKRIRNKNNNNKRWKQAK